MSELLSTNLFQRIIFPVFRDLKQKKSSYSASLFAIST